MKKILKRIIKRETDEPLPNRITSDTVAQHREQILAGGRKFKYPLQYAKHKLVFNAIIISVITLAILTFVGWWQLYPSQNTSEFMYRVTKFIPVPVAYVDGQPVLYSDYLMKCLGSMHYSQQIEQTNFKTDSGKEQIKYIKQKAMSDSVADAYGEKLAHKYKLSVSESEINAFILLQRKYGDDTISEQTFDAVNLDYFNWSSAEYRQIVQDKLIRQKVAYKIDSDALKGSDYLLTAISTNPNIDLKTLSTDISSNTNAKSTFGASGLVPRTNQDGGLSREALKLESNKISNVFKSDNGDGYYVVKLLEKNDKQVSYQYIKISLTRFDSELSQLEKQGKINYLISVSKK